MDTKTTEEFRSALSCLIHLASNVRYLVGAANGEDIERLTPALRRSLRQVDAMLPGEAASVVEDVDELYAEMGENGGA